MLHKIIYKNFKSNIRKYILFFVSNIIAVAELFIFWGLNDVVVRAVTEPSIMMGIKSDFMIAVGLITVVTILLMVFSMRYYIKLRAKDYGTFIMLGMKKKMSYMLLFAEYIIGCIGSLLIGILSGNLLLYEILYCLNQYNPQIITLQKVDPVVYKNTILLCLGVMLGIFIILLVWMDGRNLSSLMMKEEIKEKRPVSSKWLLLTVLGIVFIILAIKQYKPGTWGYYFAHIYFLIGGILIITFSGAFILEQAKKGPFYFRYALKINQLDSKYQSNILIILMLFVIHFFALSYIGTQIVEILPLDKTNSNYPYDIIWMARQNDEKYSEKIAEKHNGTVKHIPMIRATMFYSQEEIGISESTYKELTGKAYGLSGKEIVIGIENQNYQREEKVTDKVLYDLFGWLYIGKFNPNKKEFESSNILKDANYQYRIKEIHTQNVFGKFVPEDAGEGCEDTVIFSDEYFDKQWKKQAADDEEVSMLEVFSFPKTKEQMASNIFLLFSKLFILITLLISGVFIMVVKNLAEMSSYQRRYEFFHSMGMKQKEQKKNLSFEICSVGNIALGTGICLALLYVMTYSHWYEAMGEKISTAFWSYWLKLVGIYIIIQIVVQKLFVRYVNKRI